MSRPLKAWNGPLTITRLEWHGWWRGWVVEWTLNEHCSGTTFVGTRRFVRRVLCKWMDEDES